MRPQGKESVGRAPVYGRPSLPGAGRLSIKARLLAAARRPMLVRIPKAYLLVGGLGVLVLAWLMYQAGYRAGQAQAREATRSAQAQDWPTPADQGDSSGIDRAGGGPGQGARSGTIRAGTNEDPRQDGLNYAVLVHYPAEEAARLAAFLQERGVDSLVVSSHNPELFKVVALRGFAGDQLGSPAAQDYKKKLKQIGRAWKASNRNRGADLSDLYFERYQGSQP